MGQGPRNGEPASNIQYKVKTRLAVTAVVFLGLATPVFAHRLDEYLQATMIAVENDRVALQLRLVAGTEVARKVLADIDTNGETLCWLESSPLVHLAVSFMRLSR
jgi:hypothetical protein